MIFSHRAETFLDRFRMTRPMVLPDRRIELAFVLAGADADMQGFSSGSRRLQGLRPEG
jgi:hypothetical protein